MKAYSKILIALFLGSILTFLSCDKSVDNSAQIKSLQSQVGALQTRCDSLSNALRNSNTALLALSTEVLALSDKQNSEAESLDSIRSQILVILKSLSSLDSAVNKEYLLIADLTTQLSQIDANIADINSQITQINNDLAQLNQLYGTLLAQLTSLLNQIIGLSTLNNGLLAYYPFSGNANDLSGKGNDGTVHGATLSTDRFGNSNSAYSFDGISNYIASTNINLSVSASISVWVYPIGSNGSLVDKDNDASNNSGYALIYNNGTSQGFYAHVGWSGDSNNNIGPTQTITLAQNAWHHCVFTYNNGTVNLYLDGKLYFTKSGLNPISQNNDLLLFGKSVWGGGIFQGKLDEIRLWNRVISDQEIQYLYKY